MGVFWLWLFFMLMEYAYYIDYIHLSPSIISMFISSGSLNELISITFLEFLGCGFRMD